jgi:hypothetical protein
MKIYMERVEACKTCPAGSRRGTTWPKSEPVCELFMDEKEPGRMGRVIPEPLYSTGTPTWCPLDDLLEQKGETGDARYLPVSTQAPEDPRIQRSRFFKALVFWKQMREV